MKKDRFSKAITRALVLSTAAMLGLSAGGIAAEAAQKKGETIAVNVPDLKNTRPFEGWGTALCWWANRVGYSDTLAQKSADLFYGEEGLRMNIMRYNIGGGDDPAHHHITRTDSEVPGWLKWNEEKQQYEYDYNADHRQLNVLLRAVEAAGDAAVVEVFANSPPYFMTVSGCASGAVNPNDNNLREDCFDDFAEYLVHVTDYIQHELGVEVTSLSPMNEPNTDYWSAYSWKQEGCHYDEGETQSKMILAAAKALAQSRSQNVLIAVSDETSTDRQLKEYYAYSVEAKQHIGRINTHTYGEEGRAAMGELARREGFNMWMSEVDGSGTAGTRSGEMGPALWMGKKIIADLNDLTPTAWVMWQAIDNHISQEGFNGNKDSGMVDLKEGYWGIAVADHNKDEIILTQKYYGMGQFTRYIRPGSYLIPCTDDVLAAYDPAVQELVVVAVNTSARKKQLRIDLSAFVEKGTSIQSIRTSGSVKRGEKWAKTEPLSLDEEGFTAEMKANSITTWIVSGVKP